ncbi:NIPSNAP family protein [Luteimonas sp. Y-2-2-4F]|nr:NIPSNAP family protein [Luteimonas sp. Y-2-2-4F]MCD9030890.1 NIPSNAP family protein [Luteimonas sp. Y-2-2-4F]
MSRPHAPLRLALLALVLAFAPALPASGPPNGDGGVWQLRIYEIFDETLGPFHDRFRDHALRLMARHGFDLRGTWEAGDAQRLEFVYLLRWPDEATLRTAWEAFLADPEWIGIKRETAREHGRFVGEIEDRILRPTGYGPAAANGRDPARP